MRYVSISHSGFKTRRLINRLLISLISSELHFLALVLYNVQFDFLKHLVAVMSAIMIAFSTQSTQVKGLGFEGILTSEVC